MIFTREENFQTFIRRYPSVTMFCIGIIVVQWASYYYGNGPTDTETARGFGAIQTGDTSPEEWSRLVAYIFLQNGGMYHFLANFASLLILGPPLERIYGSAKFTFLFLMTGIAGGIFILLFSTNVIAAGASGSIFGLLGLYVGLMLKKNSMIGVENKSYIWGIVAINIIFTFVGPNVSISAHLGGLVCGILLSLLVPTQSFKNLARTKWSESIFHMVMVTSVIMFPLFMAKEIPLNKFNQALLKVDELKSNLQELTEEVGSQINNKGLTYDDYVEFADHNINHYSNGYLNLSHIAKEYIKQNQDYFLSKNQSSIQEVQNFAEFLDVTAMYNDVTLYDGVLSGFVGSILHIEEFDYADQRVIHAIIENEYGNFTLVLFNSEELIKEGDRVAFYGLPVGLYSYENVNGGYTDSLMIIGSYINTLYDDGLNQIESSFDSGYFHFENDGFLMQVPTDWVDMYTDYIYPIEDQFNTSIDHESKAFSKKYSFIYEREIDYTFDIYVHPFDKENLTSREFLNSIQILSDDFVEISVTGADNAYSYMDYGDDITEYSTRRMVVFKNNVCYEILASHQKSFSQGAWIDYDRKKIKQFREDIEMMFSSFQIEDDSITIHQILNW